MKMATFVSAQHPSHRRRSVRLGEPKDEFPNFLIRLGVAMLHLGEPLHLGVALLHLGVPANLVLIYLFR